MVLLPPVAPPCVSVPQAAPAVHATPSAAGRKAHDYQVQVCQPGALRSVGSIEKHPVEAFGLL